MKKILSHFGLLSLCLASHVAIADPYLTGDASTASYKEWEFELFSDMVFAKQGPDEKALSAEVKYGLLSRVELFLEMGYSHLSRDNEIPSLHGIGDSEIGFKYRFLDECTLGPKMAIEPKLGIPTGNSDVGNDKMWFELPLWLEKNWGDFSTATGAGVVFNDAIDAKNYLFAGWKVRYQVTENLNFGTEFYYQGKDSIDTQDVSLINVASIYQLNSTFSLQVGLGHSVHGPEQTIVYVGLAA